MNRTLEGIAREAEEQIELLMHKIGMGLADGSKRIERGAIILSALREAQPKETGLLPCPFCGSDVEQSDDDAWCFVCNILVRKSIWNRRIKLQQPSEDTEAK